ncbi:hypothetical protein EXIGLDRAFT_319255 [Exidia glandulosa HHB12029]|uniref:Uncharacterized protein n=1 Tax=Exidia glandulosa HHB12029 TaxID=1314781 RepID=A0A165Q433_EXIGL|nr:hypothetical protein EXIGLDRAFT_319255 [Exidia glandulosa HHB12029]
MRPTLTSYCVLGYGLKFISPLCTIGPRHTTAGPCFPSCIAKDRVERTLWNSRRHLQRTNGAGEASVWRSSDQGRSHSRGCPRARHSRPQAERPCNLTRDRDKQPRQLPISASASNARQGQCGSRASRSAVKASCKGTQYPGLAPDFAIALSAAPKRLVLESPSTGMRGGAYTSLQTPLNHTNKQAILEASLRSER